MILETITKRKIKKLAEFDNVYTQKVNQDEFCCYPIDFDCNIHKNKMYTLFYTKHCGQMLFDFDENNKIVFHRAPYDFHFSFNGDTIIFNDKHEPLYVKRCKTAFEKARFFNNTIESQKGKQLDDKTILMLRVMCDQAKNYAFNGVTQTLLTESTHSYNYLFSTDTILSNLKQLKEDVNTLPLKTFVSTYNSFNYILLEMVKKLKEEDEKTYKNTRKEHEKKEQNKLSSQAKKAKNEMKL